MALGYNGKNVQQGAEAHASSVTLFQKLTYSALALVLALSFTLFGCSGSGSTSAPEESGPYAQFAAETATPSVDLAGIPWYTGSAYTLINNNEPTFAATELTVEPFETYYALDSLDRATGAKACVGPELAPTEKRGNISEVKPTGWQSVRYDFVDGESLYNRCHLLGFQLTGENANERNLITGTRYMNTEGMLPFEEAIDDYIEATGNHVLFEVVPLYAENNLVAHGVHMQARSIEDDGRGISFNVFCYNVQPGVDIDYATGDNWESEGPMLMSLDASSSGAAYAGDDAAAHSGDSASASASTSASSSASSSARAQSSTNSSNAATNGASSADISSASYVLNTKSMKFHYTSCSAVSEMSSSNRATSNATRAELIQQGYKPCGSCNP